MTRPCSCDPRLPAMDRCGRGWVRCNEGLRALLLERNEVSEWHWRLTDRRETGNHDLNRCERDGE